MLQRTVLAHRWSQKGCRQGSSTAHLSSADILALLQVSSIRLCPASLIGTNSQAILQGLKDGRFATPVWPRYEGHMLIKIHGHVGMAHEVCDLDPLDLPCSTLPEMMAGTRSETLNLASYLRNTNALCILKLQHVASRATKLRCSCHDHSRTTARHCIRMHPKRARDLVGSGPCSPVQPAIVCQHQDHVYLAWKWMPGRTCAPLQMALRSHLLLVLVRPLLASPSSIAYAKIALSSERVTYTFAPYTAWKHNNGRKPTQNTQNQLIRKYSQTSSVWYINIRCPARYLWSGTFQSVYSGTR